MTAYQTVSSIRQKKKLARDPGEVETLPYFLSIPYLQPILGPVLISHPEAQPLPEDDYIVTFTGWFAGIVLLYTKHNFKLAHVGSTIFAASNWTVGGLGNPIVNGITSGLSENVIDQSVIIMAGGGATCESLMDEARCAKLCMFTSTLSTDTPDRVEHVQHWSAPVSATYVSPDLKYLVQAVTEVHSNKDDSSKAVTKRLSTS